MTVRDWLDGEGVLLRDGGMGTMLMDAGLKPGQCSEDFNVMYPERVRGIHDAYVLAGANFVLANTFGCNALRHKKAQSTLADSIAAGVRLAKEAAAAAKHPCFSLFDVGPLGALIEPLGDLTIEEAEELFLETMEIGANSGADAILIETVSDLAEMTAAVSAARRVCDLPIFATLTFDAHGRLFTGVDARTAMQALSALDVDMVGCNCGVGPAQVISMLPALMEGASKPVAVAPNAGLPVYRDGKTSYLLSPADFAADMKTIRDAGARLLGGCCGTTPAHIEALAALLG